MSLQIHLKKCWRIPYKVGDYLKVGFGVEGNDIHWCKVTKIDDYLIYLSLFDEFVVTVTSDYRYFGNISSRIIDSFHFKYKIGDLVEINNVEWKILDKTIDKEIEEAFYKLETGTIEKYCYERELPKKITEESLYSMFDEILEGD